MTAALLIVLAGALAPVELRGAGLAPVADPVVAVSIEGVRTGGENPRLFGWHEVKRVTGEREAEAARFAEISDSAWRARVRLARGDTLLAEPLLEELFPQFRGVDSSTAYVVAEGLLRCRIERGDHGGAVAPWIEAVRLRRQAGVVHPADVSNARSPIDRATLLAPALPPVWLDLPATRALASAEETWAEDDSDAVASALGAWYVRAARFEIGQSAAAPSETDPGDPGVALVSLMVRARTGDATERAGARAALLEGLGADFGTWREAWRRAAIGRSLLLEQSSEDRRLGMIHLLHVPVRFAESQPHLASVALAEVGAELARTGDGAGAAAIRRELVAHDPYHPAVQWFDRRVAGAGAEGGRGAGGGG